MVLLYVQDTKPEEQEPNPAQSLLFLNEPKASHRSSSGGHQHEGGTVTPASSGTQAACHCLGLNTTKKAALSMYEVSNKNIESQASHLCCAGPKEKSSYDHGAGRF